jgi:hypothetical protein
LVYTYASGAYGSNAVRVRVSLSPQNKNLKTFNIGKFSLL